MIVSVPYFEFALIDLILIAVFAIALHASKGARPLVISFICFTLTVIYSSEIYFGIWQNNSDILNHTMYGFPFVAAIFFVPLRVKISLFIQALLQLAMIVDCIVYGGAGLAEHEATWLYTSYPYLHVASILYVVFSFFGGGKDAITRRDSSSTYITDTRVLRGSPYYSGMEKG